MPANISDDRNQISLEQHELDYVLHKWSKAESISNRSILAAELRKFKADPAWAPHNRENFYRYAEESGLKGVLGEKESKTGLSGQSAPDHPYTIIREWTTPSPLPEVPQTIAQAEGSTAIQPPPTPASKGYKRRAKLIFLLFLAAIIITAIIFFIFYLKPTAATPVAENAVNTAANPKAGLIVQFKQTVKENSPVFFIGDQKNWLPGEEAKLDKIMKDMEGLKKIELALNGHTADVGTPDSQLILSIERAQAVKDYFVKNPGWTELAIKTVGKGGTELVIKDVPLSEQQANRRVEITVNSAE